MRRAKTILRGWATVALGCAVGAAAPADEPARDGQAVITLAATDVALLANRDDDDGDGRPDADDEVVNGPADERDLAALTVQVADARVTRVRVTSGDRPLRFFVRGEAGWRHAGLRAADVPIGRDPARPASVTLHVESCAWAGLPAGWDGSARVDVEARDAAGARMATVRAKCHVAPVLLRPSTARAGVVFLATGHYDNGPFVRSLRDALQPLAVPLVLHAAVEWREMWMQDTMEIATAAIPGSRMHVVLAGLRGADSFPPTLLGPDMAVARVAEPRGLIGGDAWSDWYGNLEASPPLPAHPAGRVLYGRNVRTGAGFHPDAVRFLAAQAAQPPLWIDTSWLAIKHVDEVVAFLPGADGRGVVVVPDPEEGLRLAGQLPRPAGAADVVVANRRIARLVAELLDGGGSPRAGTEVAAAGAGAATVARGVPPKRSPGLLELLGWDADRVVRVPLVFRVPEGGLTDDGGVTGAAAAWSNPVNALLLNGTVLCGACDMPPAVRDACRQRFQQAGAGAVVFLDDAPYHRRGGNVHCATNVRRE